MTSYVDTVYYNFQLITLTMWIKDTIKFCAPPQELDCIIP